MKENYSAWQIEYSQFFNASSLEEQVRFLMRFAVLAPSTHNSQPWRFVIDKDSVVIFPEPSRSLPVSDPLGRNLYISLGSALENILVAADYYHLTAVVTYAPPDTTPAAARVVFTSRAETKLPEDHLALAIPNRRSNRNPYTSRLPDAAFLAWLQDLAPKGAQIDVVTGERERRTIADIITRSRLRAFSDPAFRRELAGYKRTNFTRSHSGIPGFTMGFGNILSLFAPFAIRRWNVMRPIRKKEEALLVKHTPAFIIISSERDDVEGWVRSGQALEHIMLEAERRGLCTSMNAIPPDPAPIQEVLGTSFRPEMFVRVGYTSLVPRRSPRFAASDVTV